jgi:hypothetical protein
MTQTILEIGIMVPPWLDLKTHTCSCTLHGEISGLGIFPVVLAMSS